MGKWQKHKRDKKQTLPSVSTTTGNANINVQSHLDNHSDSIHRELNDVAIHACINAVFQTPKVDVDKLCGNENISISAIQRNLKRGFATAEKIMDGLINSGLVTQKAPSVYIWTDEAYK